MTPKQQYEARKAERAKRRADADFRQTEHEREKEAWLDMADRFVTAFERIADAMERKP